MEILGYEYITEQQAQNAVNLCNTHYGIPQEQGDITQNWCSYTYAGLNTSPFWYIIYDDTLSIVLGEPTTFDVVVPPPLFPPSSENYVGS
jgi:hypothetical protein